MLGQGLSISGLLHDTGEINLVFAHRYDDYRIQRARLYVETPVLVDPLATVFAAIESTVTVVDELAQDQNEISIEEYAVLDEGARR